MDIRKRPFNDNIVQRDFENAHDLSLNTRQFGPYVLKTMIQGYAPEYSGSTVQHSVDLPEGQQPDREMAQQIAKEIQINPNDIYGIKPGDSWVKGNMNIYSPNIEDIDKFNKIRGILDK